MKVVVAMDSLKGSLTSLEAGNAVKDGILLSKPDAHVIVKPLADGGEGTTDALVESLGGDKIRITVSGPLGKPVESYYGWIKNSNTAIMEMAMASGITLVSDNKLNPMEATTYGFGEMIKDAAGKGCRNFILGIGGSATNDGGMGMLKALGYEFLDNEGKDAGLGGKALNRVSSIQKGHVDPVFEQCTFRVACDVTNPLCGKNGATYIFGPQKGVTEDMKKRLEAGMCHFADVTASFTGKDLRGVPGAGAAGGLGFALLSYLDAELVPGIELIMDAVGLEKEFKTADFVITGEGRLDYQTSMGKTPIGVASLAKKYGVKVLAFAGSITKDARKCNNAGIDAFFPIVREATTLEEAMEPGNAKENMTAAVEQIFRIL